MGFNKKFVSIISFNSNLGLIEPAPGAEPGVKKLPAQLRKSGFFDLVDPQEFIELEPPPYSMYLDPMSYMRNTDSIAAYARKQVPILQDVIARKNFAIVLGGDCSILIGNALALKGLGEYKLFFIDGHTDFMWPALSSTHGVAGMDLCAGIEITILDPDRDPDGKIVHEFVAQIGGTIRKSLSPLGGTDPQSTVNKKSHDST